MIKPTKADIGRGVVYRFTPPGVPAEDGVITSFNEFNVFVRYKGDNFSKATDRADLDWLNGADR